MLVLNNLSLNSLPIDSTFDNLPFTLSKRLVKQQRTIKLMIIEKRILILNCIEQHINEKDVTYVLQYTKHKTKMRYNILVQTTNEI